MRALRVFLLGLFLLAGSVAPARAELGAWGALRARVLSRLHPLPSARLHYRKVLAGWERQRLGARRESRAALKLRLRNFASRVVAHPLLVDGRGRPVSAGGQKYLPDFAVIRGFGPLRWAELVEVSSRAEKALWDHPRRDPQAHKAQQRRKVEAVFDRPGKLYVLDGPSGKRGTRPVRVFKSGPLSGAVRFLVER